MGQELRKEVHAQLIEKVPFKALSWVLSKPFLFLTGLSSIQRCLTAQGGTGLRAELISEPEGLRILPWLLVCAIIHPGGQHEEGLPRWSWGEWPDVERNLGRLEGTWISEDLSGRNGLLPRCRSFECARELTCSRRKYFQHLWVANGPFPRGRSDCPVDSTGRIRAISITWLKPRWDEEPVSLNPAQCFYFSCQLIINKLGTSYLKKQFLKGQFLQQRDILCGLFTYPSAYNCFLISLHFPPSLVLDSMGRNPWQANSVQAPLMGMGVNLVLCCTSTPKQTSRRLQRVFVK